MVGPACELELEGALIEDGLRQLELTCVGGWGSSLLEKMLLAELTVLTIFMERLLYIMKLSD